MIYINKFAKVDENVQLGENTKIWHWTHISKGVTIGINCVIGQNVFIGENVKIGNGVKIQNNVSIFEGVEIYDDVFCGPSVVFTNVINPRAFIEKKNEFKKTIVFKGVSIGANSTIVCGIKIKDYAFIGAGSLVAKDVKKFEKIYGNPATHKGWMTKEGNNINDLSLKNNIYICPITNVRYIYDKNKMELNIDE